MQIETGYVDIEVDGRPMRTFVAAPVGVERYPGVLFYTDIFQLTESSLRWVRRLASYGFVVAAPEIYHRIEPADTVLTFDDVGKERGQADVEALTVAQFEVDIDAALEWLRSYPRVRPGSVGVTGHCTGGHLAFLAAMRPEVAATACWYPTGLDTGKLGADADAGSLQRASEIEGELLLIFGGQDPHTSAAGRSQIQAELERAGTQLTITVYDAAEHAFGRDIGERYDAELTDRAFAETVAFLRKRLEVGSGT